MNATRFIGQLARVRSSGSVEPEHGSKSLWKHTKGQCGGSSLYSIQLFIEVKAASHFSAQVETRPYLIGEKLLILLLQHISLLY